MDRAAQMNRVDQAIAAAEYDAAERELAAILQEDPANVDARHGMALVAYHRKELAAAESWIAEAIDRAPENPVLFSTRGNILVALERLDEAAHCFETVSRLNPKAGCAFAVAIARLTDRRPAFAPGLRYPSPATAQTA